MFGLGGMDPKKMQGMMRQLGIKQEEVAAKKVIIEKEDGKIVIEEPSVVKITMKGQESWQISGRAREEEGIREEDIKLVAEKTGKSEEQARKSLEEADGEVAEAIINLNKDE